MFIHLAKVASADIVFEIASHGHPVEVSGGVLKAFLGFNLCHLFMSDVKDFASDIISFMGCFIGNIWTVSTVILPSFKKQSIDENPTRVVGVLVDDVKERVCTCSLAKGVVPFAFEMLGELEGTNIESSGGLVWQMVIVINRGFRDRKVFIGGYMV